MDRLGIGAEDVARATGVSAADVQTQYTAALPKTQAELIAKAAADAELAARTARDTTASQATIAAAQQQAATSQGLLGPGDQTAAAAAAAALAAQQKAAADAAAKAQAAAAAAAAKAAADAAAAKAAGDAAALKAAQDAAAKAAAEKAAADAAAAAAAKATGDAAAAAAAKTAADKAAADAAAIAASNATAAQKAAAAKAAADAKAASDAAAAKAAADAAAKAAGTNSAGLTYALSQGMTQQQYYKNIFDFYSKNSGLSDSMLRSEMDRLGISPQDVAAATGVDPAGVLARYNAAKATTQAELDVQAKAQADLAARQGQWATQQAKNAADWAAQQKAAQDAQNAFAKAPMTLGQKFGSYESIPIGAQYNPAVTPGGVSPYSMVMGQMTPFQNPYANFVPGTALGGYNPNLYNQIAVSNADAAAQKAAIDASTATAQQNAQNTLGLESSSTGGMAQGGMVHGGLMFGPNPKGPDDGAVNLDLGEYVIKKSSVDKYGKGLLDMINEGKMPAKKIRSLLD
jgi:hypothetical protein